MSNNNKTLNKNLHVAMNRKRKKSKNMLLVFLQSFVLFFFPLRGKKSASAVSFLSPHIRIQIQFACVGFNFFFSNKRQNTNRTKIPLPVHSPKKFICKTIRVKRKP